MNTYTALNLIRLTLLISKTSDASPVTPSTLTAKIQPPGDGAPVDLTSTILTDATGSYYLDYTIPNVGGIYTYEWIASGNVIAAQLGQFLVNPVTF